MCTQVSSRSLIARIQLPVSTDRSPISLKTGSGASVISGPTFFVSVRQASPGRPLITIAQLPQMPARQTKSNCSDGSSLSRISLSAMKSVMPSRLLELVGLLMRDAGRVGRVVAHDVQVDLVADLRRVLGCLHRCSRSWHLSVTTTRFPTGSRCPRLRLRRSAGLAEAARRSARSCRAVLSAADARTASARAAGRIGRRSSA